MESILITIAIIVVVAIGGALALKFVAKLGDPDIAGIAKLGIIAIVVIAILVLVWRLVVRSGVV
jgi:hypothetical protein